MTRLMARCFRAGFTLGALFCIALTGTALRATSGATITQPSAPTTVWPGQAIAFAGTSTNDSAADYDSATVAYSWAFGDGATGAGASTSHAYATPGTYTVTLTATWTLKTFIDGLHPRTITTTQYLTATQTETVVARPVINSLSASTTNALQGAAVTLTWSVSNASSLSLSGIGAVTGTSTVVYPTATTTYTLTATNGGGSVTSAVTVNTQPVTVSLTPGTASLNLGGSVTFTGSATAGNPAVTWTATGGSLSGSTYTGTTSGSFTVKATSVADPSKSASATVSVATVAVATPVPVPANGQCFVGGTVSLSALVSGAANSGVTWSVNGGGSINGSGVFSGTAQGTWVVTATSIQDPTKKATANVQVVPVTVSITQGNVTVKSGLTQAFTATVAGPGTPNQAVTWSVVESNGGSIATNGTYTAPATAGDYTVKATSVQDSTCSATVRVHVPGWVMHLRKDIVYVGSKEVAEDDGTNTWVTLTDHLGTPRYTWNGKTSNPVLNVDIIEQKFMPYGESLSSPAAMAAFKKGFTNHEQTDGTGLVYMQGRYYSPWWGRFLSPDAGRDQHSELTQKWNIYSYVSNNPVTAIDANGEDEYWVVVNERDPKRFATVYVTNKDGGLRAQYQARANGFASTHHNRLVENGDTPYGTANRGRIMTKEQMQEPKSKGGYGIEKAKSYGDVKISLEPTSGELLTSGRTGIAVHGGAKTLADPYEPVQPLINTQGCVRMENRDLLTERNWMIMNDAFGGHDHWHVGSSDTLWDGLPESVRMEVLKQNWALRQMLLTSGGNDALATTGLPGDTLFGPAEVQH